MAIRVSRRSKLNDGDVGEEPQNSATPIELLSLTQAAAFAGVAPITVRRWVRERALPAYRAGVQIRIDKADLINFIRAY